MHCRMNAQIFFYQIIVFLFADLSFLLLFLSSLLGICSLVISSCIYLMIFVDCKVGEVIKVIKKKKKGRTGTSF